MASASDMRSSICAISSRSVSIRPRRRQSASGRQLAQCSCALRLALERPELVRSLVLVEPVLFAAAKAAEDQDNITLSKNSRRAATRLRLHLDLSAADADHEKLAGSFTYPEWNHRTRAYMPDHCRVLEAPPQPATGAPFASASR